MFLKCRLNIVDLYPIGYWHYEERFSSRKNSSIFYHVLILVAFYNFICCRTASRIVFISPLKWFQETLLHNRSYISRKMWLLIVLRMDVTKEEVLRSARDKRLQIWALWQWILQTVSISFIMSHFLRAHTFMYICVYTEVYIHLRTQHVG